MTRKIKNIEEEFLSLENKDGFPQNNDYISIYKVFKEQFDRDIHPEIKSKILEIEKEGYYNDHGVDHIKMVIERATRLLNEMNASICEDKDTFYISPYEVFLLLMSIQLHDAGHLIGSREEHAGKGKELLAKFDVNNVLSTAERKTIGDIARAHGGKDDPIGKLELETNISHMKVRPRLLAAILRLADELAEDKTRASNFLLKLDKIVEASKIFHLYSASLDSICISGGEIKLDFYILDKYLMRTYSIGTEQKYLLDEIYDRTFKTFTESLYCSRFFPERLRIDNVKVSIKILDSNNDDEIKTIYYELEEKGYPFIANKNIYEVCCDSLMENKNRIDGEYIKTYLEKRNDE